MKAVSQKGFEKAKARCFMRTEKFVSTQADGKKTRKKGKGLRY